MINLNCVGAYFIVFKDQISINHEELCLPKVAEKNKGHTK